MSVFVMVTWINAVCFGRQETESLVDYEILEMSCWDLGRRNHRADSVNYAVNKSFVRDGNALVDENVRDFIK